MADNSVRQAFRRGRGWRTRTAVALVAAGSVTAISASLTAAQAVPATGGTVTIVRVVSRAPFGNILATVWGLGRTLYILPTGSCTGACLGAWPPLLMPVHTRIPIGTKCLGTAKFGTRFQVTYRGKRLYLFAGDTGKSVTGNNVAGFKVARVITKPCP